MINPASPSGGRERIAQSPTITRSQRQGDLGAALGPAKYRMLRTRQTHETPSVIDKQLHGLADLLVADEAIRVEIRTHLPLDHGLEATGEQDLLDIRCRKTRHRELEGTGSKVMNGSRVSAVVGVGTPTSGAKRALR